MEVRGGGTATFTGNGSIYVTKASVAAGASLVTGGKVTFPAIDLPAGATAMLPDPSMLANGNLVGGGTLVLAPGAGNTVTMSGGNTEWTGRTVIENGTVKYGSGRSFGSEATAANVLVKGGATLDQNGQRLLGSDDKEKAAVRMEEGAILTSSGDIDDNKGGVITKLSLDGDATVRADGHMVCMSKHFNAAYVTIELGTHTLKKTGAGEFFVSVCNITGTGTLDIREGMVGVTHPFAGTGYGKCQNGTINIHDGAAFRFRNYDGKAAKFSVNNLVLNGRVERDGTDENQKTPLDHMLTVTGSITGKGTATMLAMAPGAKFKPNGTDYLTIVESLSGAMAVDMTGLNVSSAVNIPLFRLGKAVSGPSVAGFDSNWELKISNSGDYVCYDLVRKPASVHIDEIDADVALPAEWLKGAGMAASLDSAEGVKAFAEGAGANGIPVWKSYCLGLDPKSAASVVVCEGASGAAAGSGKIAIKARNVRVPEGLEGAAVTAVLQKRTEGGGWVQAGDAVAAVPGGEIVFETEPESGSAPTFYRIKIAIAPASAD